MSERLFDLSGRVAIVTGASRGLGQYMARALARAGADLAVTSRRVERLAETQLELEALGRRVLPLELEVRDYHSIHPGEQRGLQCAQARPGDHLG